MLRITITLKRGRHRAAAWISAPLVLALALVLSGSLGAPAARAGESARLPAATPASYQPAGGGRHFYLTKANHATNQVLTACAAGYHMASLWEILDVSNVTYDDAHPAAYTQADSGEGPPSSWFGWVRTGYDSSSSSTTGTGNCNNWTSTSNTAYGVAVRLSSTWETAPGDIGGIWDAASFPCSSFGPVWCVGDFNPVYLPVVLRNAQ